jgi:release factor glutamine methyltransferase
MQSDFENIRKQLQGLYSENEIRSFYFLIYEKITGLTRTELIINKNTIFSIEQRKKADSFIEKLKKHEPIQYILGETVFYDLPFLANPSVLIPRPETEELVEWIVNEHISKNGLKILDIGTGSGCIAISLKFTLKSANVWAFDISESALETAGENAILNNVEVTFQQIDILKTDYSNLKWDIIVSNPPYISDNEKPEIQPNVLNYEPHLALFVNENDPMIFYKRIADYAQKYLNSGGKLFFEIHRDAGEKCIDILEKSGFKNVELRKDLFGNNRMIKGEK